jgi:NAD(P)-dependent dehydrogenase (short-subunit alcohol dehydrogenase family)
VSSPGSKIFADDLMDGQVCLVSGAGSGIGRETALELARLGATVVGCGRRLEPVEETAAMIEAAGGSAAAFSCDIRDEDAVETMVAEVEHELLSPLSRSEQRQLRGLLGRLAADRCGRPRGGQAEDCSPGR